MILIVNYYSKYSSIDTTCLPVEFADESDLSIQSLIVTLREAFKIHPSVLNLRIKHGDGICSDGKTITDYNICNESTIELIRVSYLIFFTECPQFDLPTHLASFILD